LARSRSDLCRYQSAVSIRLVRAGPAFVPDGACTEAPAATGAHTDPVGALRDIAETEPTPGLPCITSKSQDAPRIARAVQAAIDDLTDEDRGNLRIRGVIKILARRYLITPTAAFPDALLHSS